MPLKDPVTVHGFLDELYKISVAKREVLKKLWAMAKRMKEPKVGIPTAAGLAGVFIGLKSRKPPRSYKQGYPTYMTEDPYPTEPL